MNGENDSARFKRLMLPHLDAAYNLARWLMRSDADSEDVVQDAMLRAFKAFNQWHGDNGRAWVLKIVRNCCYTALQISHERNRAVSFDESLHGAPEANADSNPETILTQKLDKQRLREALESLPIEFREAMVLRELECLSYKEIAAILQVPIGTVMSRLARARIRLRDLFLEPALEPRKED